MEYIAHFRLPLTAVEDEDAEQQADDLRARIEELTGRDAYLDEVRLMEG